MLERRKPILLSTFLLTLALGLGAASAQAACKGSAQSACEKDPSCSWVKGYTRKDGVEVSPYCKSKPAEAGKSESKESDSNEKTDTTKTEDDKK